MGEKGTSSTEARSWWATLPGVLTAIAGLITATAALIGALVAAGVLKSEGDGASPNISAGAAGGITAESSAGSDLDPSESVTLGTKSPPGMTGVTAEPPPNVTQAPGTKLPVTSPSTSMPSEYTSAEGTGGLVFYGELRTGKVGKTQFNELDDKFALGESVIQDWPGWSSACGFTYPDGSIGLVFYNAESGLAQFSPLLDDLSLGKSTTISWPNWSSVCGFTYPDRTIGLVFYDKNTGQTQFNPLRSDWSLGPSTTKTWRNWSSVSGFTYADGTAGLIFYGEQGTGHPGKTQFNALYTDFSLGPSTQVDWPGWTTVGFVWLPTQ